MESPERLYAKHRGLIRKLINSIVVNNPAVVDTQDLQQAGALAVIAALQSYDPSVGSLQAYIRTCVWNALLEEANSHNAVFKVDEKVRRQANALRKMKNEGLDDKVIMASLGIKTQATFMSLLNLSESHTIDIDQIEISATESIDIDSIYKVLGEIGLDDRELLFIDLVVKNQSTDEIISTMGIGRTNLYAIKASIKDKILEWGKK